MGFGSFRPVLTSILAVLFGLAQLLCACVSAQAALITHVDAQVVEASAPEFGLWHSVLAEIDDTTESDHSNHDDSPHHDHSNHGGEHAEDCTHCEGYSAVKPSVDVQAKVSTDLPSQDKALETKPFPRLSTRAGMSPTALAGLRWLDPPRDTLVSLLIRLQR